MATTLFGWRPSALPAACPSIVPALPAVVRTESRYAGLVAVGVPAGLLGKLPELPGAERRGAVKINNYIGTPAAAPAMGLAAMGATTSSVIATAADDLRNQQHGVDKVKGFNARGIPPRGRREV
jgi:hypothetical protein